MKGQTDPHEPGKLETKGDWVDATGLMCETTFLREDHRWTATSVDPVGGAEKVFGAGLPDVGIAL
jgi:hypothetical protein